MVSKRTITRRKRTISRRERTISRRERTISRRERTISRRAAVARVAAGLAALALAGCGAVRVQPTTPNGSTKLASRGKIDSPLTMDNYLGCLRQSRLPVAVVSPIKLQVGAAVGPTIVFLPTPGAAQEEQINGSAPGAEVIGNALVYPHQGSATQLTSIEGCLAHGVQG